MTNIHFNTNLKVKYICELNNCYELAGPPLELEGSIPPPMDPKALIPTPCENVEENK